MPRKTSVYRKYWQIRSIKSRTGLSFRRISRRNKLLFLILIVVIQLVVTVLIEFQYREELKWTAVFGNLGHRRLQCKKENWQTFNLYSFYKQKTVHWDFDGSNPTCIYSEGWICRKRILNAPWKFGQTWLFKLLMQDEILGLVWCKRLLKGKMLIGTLLGVLKPVVEVKFGNKLGEKISTPD